MLYLFGFVHASPGSDATLPGGVLGRPLVVPLDDDRWAVVAEVEPSTAGWEDPSAEQTAAAVLHHDAVVSACLGLDVVPARFGTLLRDERDLREIGVRHADDLTDAFERIRGRSEYDVRLPARRPVAASGADYLRRRRDELSGAATDPDLAAVREVAPDLVERRSTRDQRRLAVLVTPDELARLRTHLASVPGAELRGPYPPYTFCRGIGGDGG